MPRAWTLNPIEILSFDELHRVVCLLKSKARRSPSAWTNLAIVRLACCCGLRASEISGLSINDVRLPKTKPHLALPGTICKYKRSRVVPLWWDGDTLSDVADFAWLRRNEGAQETDRLIISTWGSGRGKPLDRNQVRRRFLWAMRGALGRDRAEQLTTHSGRHTFCSLALAGGRTLAEIQAAAGHASIATTSIYLHAAPDSGEVGNLFSPRRPPEVVTRPVRPITPAS